MPIEYIYCVDDYCHCIRIDLDKSKTIWVFEGKIDKKRHNDTKAKRATTISRALKRMLKSSSSRPVYGWRTRKTGQKLISSVYGRPGPWLTKEICKEMARRKYIVDYSDYEESDSRICRMALEMKSSDKTVVTPDATVIASDSDFIALSPPGSIRHMVKVEKGGFLKISKDDVLKSEGLTETQLFVAYCVAGCDNIAAHVNNVGWGRSRRWAIVRDMTIQKVKAWQSIPMKAGEKSVKIEMAAEIKR